MNTSKMIFKTTFVVILIFICTLSYTSCKKITDPPDPNDEELITTLQINFTDSAGVQPNVTAIFRDTDGGGGNSPSQWDTIKLKANTTYFATILLLDETKTPADTISNEVFAEAVDHLFCFTTNGINTTVLRTDLDANNLEIGLQSKWINGAAGSGTIQVTLRHQPDIKNGTCGPGASDIDVTFQCVINL